MPVVTGCLISFQIGDIAQEASLDSCLRSQAGYGYTFQRDAQSHMPDLNNSLALRSSDQRSRLCNPNKDVLIYSGYLSFASEKRVTPRLLTEGVLNFQTRERPFVRYPEMGLGHVAFVNLGFPFPRSSGTNEARMHYR